MKIRTSLENKNKQIEVKDILFDAIEEIDEAIGYESDNEENGEA